MSNDTALPFKYRNGCVKVLLVSEEQEFCSLQVQPATTTFRKQENPEVPQMFATMTELLRHLERGPDEASPLTVFLLVVELRLWELYIEGDDEGTSDVVVVKVWQALAFLPHPSSRLGDLVSHDVDLPRVNTADSRTTVTTHGSFSALGRK